MNKPSAPQNSFQKEEAFLQQHMYGFRKAWSCYTSANAWCQTPNALWEPTAQWFGLAARGNPLIHSAENQFIFNMHLTAGGRKECRRRRTALKLWRGEASPSVSRGGRQYTRCFSGRLPQIIDTQVRRNISKDVDKSEDHRTSRDMRV